MTRKTKLLVSFTCGLLAMGLVAMYTRHVRVSAEDARQEALARYGGEIAQLVVATRNLDAGSVIKPSDIEVKDWLVDLAPLGCFTRSDEVVGKTLTSAVAQGQPVVSLAFKQASDALEIPEGKVGISLAYTDKLGIPAALSGGVRVVAYSVLEHETTVLSDDVIVLSGGSDSSNQLTAKQTISIAVAPDAVGAILKASAQNTLRLVIPAQ